MSLSPKKLRLGPLPDAQSIWSGYPQPTRALGERITARHIEDIRGLLDMGPQA